MYGKIFLKKIFFFILISVYVCLHIGYGYIDHDIGVQKRSPDPLGLEFQAAVSHLTWMIEAELKPSVSPVWSLNPRDVSPAHTQPLKWASLPSLKFMLENCAFKLQN